MASYAGSATSDVGKGDEGGLVLSLLAHWEHSGNGTSLCISKRWAFVYMIWYKHRAKMYALLRCLLNSTLSVPI